MHVLGTFFDRLGKYIANNIVSPVPPVWSAPSIPPVSQFPRVEWLGGWVGGWMGGWMGGWVHGVYEQTIALAQGRNDTRATA